MDLIECAKIKINEAVNSQILPEGVKSDLKNSGNTFLTVYTKKSKTLRFFPTKDEGIWWIKIAINSFSPETSGIILAKLNKLVSEFIYSTGVCISKSDCFWDGIVLESSIKTSRDDVINTLQEVPNVTKVTIRTIE
ncbi:MAG: hypothetical protein EAX90_02815 [Candidatus Heimdallarchaeota archaeon]|nr:hypothetical protein [Candidatus Heimdallarchaeota archaeon]